MKRIARLETELATHDPPVVALPSAQPLAVGDYIIVRTLDALMAIDFKTGKRAFPLAMNSVEDVHTASDRLFGEPQEATDLLSLERQLIDDSGSSKFSSDGENVYLVSTQSHLRAPHELFLPNPELPRRNTGKEFNWLEAHDLQSDGKLLWTLGGPATSGNPLAGALFLGPPLPLDGVLYCLVEWNGAIELVAIQPQPDHSSVSVLWKQHLAAASHRYGSQANRRLLGATPSFSDGFLVCPTSSGAVVTVDLSTRSLQWGFKYDQAPTILLSRAQQIHAGRAANRFDRWMDATAIIKDGRVFLTPPFSNRLYCLDLISGALLWDVPRNQGLFIAATTAEAVFVCGTKQIEVFGIGEGARIATIPFPSRVAPSGRGLQTIDSYLLPMTNGEIAKIDLAAATMAERISLRGIAGQPGPVVGNLVAFKGSIVSQSLRGVDCFHQLGHLKQRSAATLAQTPDDAEALTAAAIVQLESGQRAAAIDLLQKSAQQGAGELTRVLLVNNLRAMIREDFAGNQNLNDQVDRLLVTTEERSAFLRDVAHGLYTTGEYRASFEVYLEISDLVWEELERGEHELRELETHWQVREDRFLAARLKTLYRLADRADQAYMDELIGTRLQQLLE
ncbi:MAG: PQQ-like beta-propeller repeat protein, partial [Pirellulales bacterium]|nr:PQQ-like beta-propeller repeat protein [Pirellulales bacterium]